jgi:uncharacterized phage protein (TIGR01671 family)
MSDRVIKFRCWDKGKGVMIYEDSDDNQFLIDLDGNVQGYSDDDGGKSGMWEHSYKVDVVLLQFTGLLDKNGKEIFEGDVNLDDDNKKSEVLFYAGGFYFKYSETEYKSIGSFAPFNYLVIGNIYENGELIK